MIETRIGMCKICPAYCPIEVTVEDGRAVKVVGDRKSPLYGGYSCPKGRALPEAHYGPSRLLHSQRRRADGSYEAIPTEQAISEIAARMQAIMGEHGADSIAYFPGNGGVSNPLSSMMPALFAMAMGTYPERFFSVQMIDQPGKVIAQALHGRWQAGHDPFHTSDVWMLVGANPVISKMGLGQNPGQVIKQAVQGGMKLIVVDPRATESATHAFLHVQSQPGQDPTLLAGFLNIILREGLYDADFVRDNTIGLEALAAQVAGFTPAHVAAVCGVPVDQIELAARTFAGAKHGCVVTGTGPHFALHGTLIEYLALCLNTVCGRWVGAGQPNGQPHVLLPDVPARAQPLAPYQPWDDSIRERIHNLPRNIVGSITGTLAEQILTPGKGQVRALICSGSNPMVSLPDQVRTSKALKSLDLLVCVDVEMSNTARMADYIIPDRLTLETPGCSHFVESMKYYGMWTQGFEWPYAMYVPAVVEPPTGSDVIEIWQFFYELAKKLGKQLVYYANSAGVGQHWDQQPVAIPLPLDRRPTTEEMFEFMCHGSRVPLAEVKKHPHGKLYDELDHVVLPRAADCDARLQLADPVMMAELGEVLAKDGDTAMPSEEFPLLLTPRRTNNMLNSIGRMNPRLTGKRPYNPAFVNPADLARFGLESGDMVSIRSQHGVILGVVEADARLRAGTLSMSHCFGPNPDEADDPLGQGGCTSRLLDANAEFDPIFGQPRMGAVPVAITAYSAAVAVHSKVPA